MPNLTVVGDTIYADGVPFATLHAPDPARGVSFTDLDRIVFQLTNSDEPEMVVCPLCEVHHDGTE